MSNATPLTTAQRFVRYVEQRNLTTGTLTDPQLRRMRKKENKANALAARSE